MNRSTDWAIKILGKWRAVEGDKKPLKIIDRTKKQIENDDDLNKAIKNIKQERAQETHNQTRNTLLFAQAVLEHLI